MCIYIYNNSYNDSCIKNCARCGLASEKRRAET